MLPVVNTYLGIWGKRVAKYFDGADEPHAELVEQNNKLDRRGEAVIAADFLIGVIVTLIKVRAWVFLVINIELAQYGCPARASSLYLWTLGGEIPCSSWHHKPRPLRRMCAFSFHLP
jgi:hypothetical protein